MNQPPAVPAAPVEPKNSGLAIWSLVLGILGVVLLLVCLGPLFAIPAVICGHLAYSRIKRSGGVLAGQSMALAGLITGYISIGLSLVLVPMMLAIAIPNFVKARQMAQQNGCIINLQKIDAVKQQWALEKGKSAGDVPAGQDLAPYLKGGFDSLRCPAGGTYTINPVGEKPACSIPNHRLPEP